MTAQLPADRADWTDLLAPGETILWQGRPDSAPYVTWRHLATLAQGGLALGLFLYLLARLNMGIPPYWDVRWIVLFIFFKSVPVDILASVLHRRRARYALTTRRAIVVTEGRFGQKLQSFPILPGTELDFVRGRRFSSLYFAKAKPGLRSWLWPAPAPGFERLRDGDRVFALVGALQQDEGGARWQGRADGAGGWGEAALAPG